MYRLVTTHPRILLFGIFQLFFTAPGQSFLLSFFIGSIFLDIGISKTAFASLYSLATLLAALLLNPAGRILDKYSPQKVLPGLTFLMALGCWTLSISTSYIGLFGAFFLLRLIGQGVFSLTAGTLISKKFHRNRAKAMGIITLGYPLSEMVFPILSLFLLSFLGWRETYLVFGLLMIVVMLPLQLFLIKKEDIHSGEFLEGETSTNPQQLPSLTLKPRARTPMDVPLGKVILDPNFYLIICASCIPPMIVTGLFFHQSALFSYHHWPIGLAATGLTIYAICKAVASLFIGPFVDRNGPISYFILLILMLGSATLLTAFGGPDFIVYAYFILMGLALGISSPVTNVVWPNMYGTTHIGSIKGFASTFRNGFTAFGPLPLALAMDYGIGITPVLLWTGLGVCVLAVIPYWVARRNPDIHGLYSENK
jgi:MFS family permease